MTTATAFDIAKRDVRLNEMILEGDALEAFEKFYAEDVVMQDQDMGPGKERRRIASGRRTSSARSPRSTTSP